ncbi:hypothetical protein [Lacrimispora indolis]|uniref:hypothetical protein n=1 Tax=Lacrimispora indolis TaxID=69825 RepID=UPI0004628209|nr:hypothetical protein [[Clostridium] methoxybenzovorans]
MIEGVSDTFAVQWLIVAAALGLFTYKAYPPVKKKFEEWRAKRNKEENAETTLQTCEAEIKVINEKLGRDYARLNKIDEAMAQQAKNDADSLEERELIISSLLGIVKGLRELGANGPTKEVQHNIEDYLVRRAHR